MINNYTAPNKEINELIAKVKNKDKSDKAQKNKTINVLRSVLL